MPSFCIAFHTLRKLRAYRRIAAIQCAVLILSAKGGSDGHKLHSHVLLPARGEMHP